MFYTPQDNNKYRIRGFLVQSLEGGKGERPSTPILLREIRVRAHEYKLSPPKRWINFLPIPYQAEREREGCAIECLFLPCALGIAGS